MTAFILMGVSGSGKSTVGARVARELGLTFIEGDEFHPPENVARMASGVALTDALRAPWIDALASAINARQDGRDVIVACSALSHFVRDRLREEIREPVQFIFLTGRSEIIQRRLQQRGQHFMKAGMLGTQLAALEPPEHAFAVNVEQPLDAVCTEVAAHIRGRGT